MLGPAGANRPPLCVRPPQKAGQLKMMPLLTFDVRLPGCVVYLGLRKIGLNARKPVHHPIPRETGVGCAARTFRRTWKCAQKHWVLALRVL